MKQKTVIVRGITLGEGRPKICAPLVGETEEELLAQAAALEALPVEVAEWRCDWYRQVEDLNHVTAFLPQLREALGEIPLLMTFRTDREGGQREISKEGYIALLEAGCRSGCIDLVDVELFAGVEVVSAAVRAARAAGVAVVLSSHDFTHTPPVGEMVARLRKMQDLGADIAKLAVMPSSQSDVAALVEATVTMKEKFARIPLITMSMSAAGVVSRLTGEAFGSCLTFGAVGRSSAPGQIGVEELSQVLEVIHQAMR